MRKTVLRPLLVLFIAHGFAGGFLFSAETDGGSKLIAALAPLLDVIAEKSEHYTVRAKVSFGKTTAQAEIGRESARDYWLSVKGGKDVDALLLVNSAETRIDLPLKNAAFVGKGEMVANGESLKPSELLQQAAKFNTSAQIALAFLQGGDREALGPAIELFATIDAGAADADGFKTYSISLNKKSPIRLKIKNDPKNEFAFSAEIRIPGSAKDAPDNVVELSIAPKAVRPVAAVRQNEIAIPRAEIDRALQRGSLRALDILNDNMHAKAPADSVTSIPGARLEIKDGQRVCYLTGTPAEMGRAHGKLLRSEIRRVTDSTLYVVGMYYSIAKGQWFLQDIRNAWKRLEPHCDKEYLEELDGLAEGAGIDKDEMRIANIFPELFHCSGFAIANEATVGGKLFHGRVLDYMTEIGLQHVQVDFVSRGSNRRGTVNVGYAGFIGCVTGMNDAQISMGEMGGRGEGNWDGTPMAFLMRRVLEHAETLEQARAILEKAKRTCEYYYVVADGKTRSAYGVAAWPEKIDFLKQGDSHELLPNGMPGCVLLSAGDRYKLLSQRAKEGHGKLDEAGALQLMSRPVSMTSNLHSVLFVPEDQIYHAAHASLRGHRPASETKYVRHDFKAQLKVLDELETAAKLSK